MKSSEKLREAIQIFNKMQDCKDAFSADPRCDMNCGNCEYNVFSRQRDMAVAAAISALEFRERYDQLWEEIKAAGMQGKEVEIHHSGRVFSIREVAQ